MRTTDGRSVDVIHLGSWTHGLGPDFRDALLSIESGPVISGSVELHLRTRGWIEHGHHFDPSYNSVELHVVGSPDDVETRRADGKVVPTVVLNIAELGLPTPEYDWSLVGGEVCAESLSRRQPEVIRQIIAQLGDIRITARSARIEGRFAAAPPETVLYAEIMDAFGYTTNREPMSAIVRSLPWDVLSTIGRLHSEPLHTTLGLFLGIAGYLPISDVEAEHTGLAAVELAKLNELWTRLAAEWSLIPMASTNWKLARIRPANHPIRRLIQAATLFSETDFQPLSSLFDSVRSVEDPTGAIMQLINNVCAVPIGEDRARAISTNVVIPFAFALSTHIGDKGLADSAAEVWEALPPAESNERTRRAARQVSGPIGIRNQGARLQQGLIHLDLTLCEPRRCFECPVAGVVLQDQQINDPSTAGSGKIA